MEYKVILTSDAERDLDGFLHYLINEKQEFLAARNVMRDFEETKLQLASAADSLKLCENPKLKKLGYRRINFRSHRYFMLYRIADDRVVIDAIFHSLQDYENKMI